MLFLWQNSDRIERVGHLFHTLSFFNLHFESYSLHINRTQDNVNKHPPVRDRFLKKRNDLAITCLICSFNWSYFSPLLQLVKSIRDVGWGLFKIFVSYKADWANKIVVHVDRFSPSTKRRQGCKEKTPCNVKWTRMGISNLWYTSRLRS